MADKFVATPPSSVKEACDLWIDHFWPNYQTKAGPDISVLKALDGKQPFDPLAPAGPNVRTEEEQKKHNQLKLGLVVGFCIGGYHISDRQPCAFEIIFDPLNVKPTPKPVQMGETRCWGAPKVFNRIVHGIDPEIQFGILNSGKWTGTQDELNILLSSHVLYLPGLPIRDAIDFVYSIV